jgi:hypothetical protein
MMKKNLVLFLSLTITAPVFIKAMETPKIDKVGIKTITLQNRRKQLAKCVTMRIPSEMSSQDMLKASRENMRAAYYCAATECFLCLGTTYYLYRQLPLLQDDPTYFEYLKAGLTSFCGYGNMYFCHQTAETYCHKAVDLKCAAVVMEKSQPAAKNIFDANTLGKQAHQS